MDKAIKPMIRGVHPLLSYVSPNLSELRAMYKEVTGKKTQNTNTNGITSEEFLIVTIRSSPVSLSCSLSLTILCPFFPHYSSTDLSLISSLSHSCTLSLILSLPPSLSVPPSPSLSPSLPPSRLAPLRTITGRQVV